MIIRKFIASLSNKEKGELIRSLADVAYKGKGIVFDYLYELASFIEQEPDKVEEPKPVVNKVGRAYRNNYPARSDETLRNANASVIPVIDLNIGERELNSGEKTMIATGDKIRAIRSLRMRYDGLGLKEAKDMVDGYHRSIQGV